MRSPKRRACPSSSWMSSSRDSMISWARTPSGLIELAMYETTVSISIQYALVSIWISCSRSACISAPRIPCPGEVIGVPMLGSSVGVSENLLSVQMPKVDRLEHMEGVPESLWARLRAQPDRAPELIALAAADRFAPQAERWVRASGPGLSPEELGRMAVKQHVRLAR